MNWVGPRTTTWFKNFAFLTTCFEVISCLFQQPGIPQQQSPYMMMGGSQQQQQPQPQPQSQQAGPQQPYAQYIMQQGGMKAGAMPQSQQYYGNMSMGRQVMVSQSSLSGQPQHIANQMQKAPQDYASFQQQQQMQHRFPRGGMEVSLPLKRTF